MPKSPSMRPIPLFRPAPLWLTCLALAGCGSGEENPGTGAPEKTQLGAEALNQQGVDADGLGLYQEALGYFDQALEKNPWVPEVHKNRGNVLYKLNKKAEAVEAYRKALELNREDADLHNYVIEVLGELGRFEEAIEACLVSQEQVPDNFNAYLRRGQAHFSLEQYEEALLALDDASALDAENQEVLITRCKTLIELGFLDEALTDAKKLEESGSPYAKGLEQAITAKAKDG